MATETIEDPGLPEGAYNATFKGEERKEFQFGERGMLQFEVTDGEYAGTVGTAFCGTRPTVKSNRGKYLAWLAGEKAPRKDLAVDVSEWIGRRYRIDVTIPLGAESARVTRFSLLDDVAAAMEPVGAVTDDDDDVPF